MSRVVAIYAFGCLVLIGAPCIAQPISVGPLYGQSGGKVSIVVDTHSASTTLPDKSAFKLVEDGDVTVVASDVKSFRDSEHGLMVLFLIDVSGSMKGAPLDHIRTALNGASGAFALNDRVGVNSFASDVREAAPFDGAFTALAKGAPALTIRDHATRLRDAIDSSLRQLAAVPGPAWKRLIAISDGRDSASKEKAQDVIALAQSLHIPVDTVGCGAMDGASVDLMQSLAQGSGGLYEFAATEALPTVIRRLIQTMEATSVVSFDRPVGQTRTQTLNVEYRAGPATVRSAAPLAAAVPKTAMPATPKSASPIKEKTGMNLWIPISSVVVVVALAGLAFWLIRRKRTVQPPEAVTRKPPALPGSNRKARPKTRVDEGSEGEVPGMAPLGRGAVLEVIEGPLKGRRIPITSEEFRIGADSDNDLALEADTFVSGHHAELKQMAGELVIDDPGSHNGTFVNGERVSRGSRRLLAGDVIRVGTSQFRVLPADYRGASR